MATSNAQPDPVTPHALVSAHCGGDEALARALEQALATALDEARGAWPSVPLSAERVVSRVLGRLPADPSALEALARMRVSELALALSCAAGVPQALAAFEASYGPHVRAALGKVRGAELEELEQLVREKLFAGPAPRIGEYSGEGALRNWLRVTATRLALDASRRRREEQPADYEARAAALPDAQRDPELAYLEKRYGAEFRLAFERGVKDLEGVERTVLRWHYVQRLSVDEIAAARGTHRATAARQLQRAREHLMAATRARLGERLAVADDELDSVLRVLDSQVPVSVQRLLADEPSSDGR